MGCSSVLFQVTEVNKDLKKKIDELQTEMKKFKAVFLKQENRIRGLETKLTNMNVSVTEDTTTTTAAAATTGNGTEVSNFSNIPMHNISPAHNLP